MFAAASASTVTALVCAPAPVGRLSSVADSRAAIVSRPDVGPGVRSQTYGSLRGRDLFARAYRRGVRRRCGAVTVITLEAETDEPQLGVVAGKRVGSAVARNRAKRRLRAAASRCDLQPNTVYVLVAERGVLTAEFPRLVDCISAGVAGRSVTEETT